MNPKSTGILFVVAVALGAFVYFYEIEGEQGRKDAEAATKRLFGEVEQESIDTITLLTTDEKRVEIRRVDDRWRIAAPLDFPADAFAIDSIASALTTIQSESVVEDPRPPEVYGLGEALGSEEHRVRFAAAGSFEGALSVGNETPVGSSTYAAIEGRDTVFIVASHEMVAFKKSFEDLREKRIARFDRSSVRSIRLTWPGSHGAAVEIEPAGEGWRLVAPIQSDADATTVDGLLSSLSSLRADGFIDEPGAEVLEGLERPVFEARIELAFEDDDESAGPEGTSKTRVVSVALGGVSADGTERIVRGAEASLYTIPVARTEDFPTGLAPYRFRQLAKFPSIDAKRVELGFLTEEGETIAITATKGEDGWTATPDEFEEGKLASLVSELSRLRADSILADSLGPDELAAIGIEPPQVSIAVYGDDEAPLGEVRLGVSRSIGTPAQIPGNATVFKLDLKVGEHIPLSHEALINRFLAAAPVEVPADDSAPVSLPDEPTPN